MKESQEGAQEPAPYFKESSAVGEWREWDESHPLEKECEEVFAAAFELSYDPLYANIKPFFGRLAPPVPPMRYARHFYMPDDPDGEALVRDMLNRVGGSAAGKWRRQEQIIAIKNELCGRVYHLTAIIERLLGGVKRVLKLWLHEQFEALNEEPNEAQRYYERQSTLGWVRGIWYSFASEEGEINGQYARPPVSAPIGAPLCVRMGLMHYHQLLEHYWRQAAYLDLKRHTLDMCIQALLMDQPVPTWEDVKPPPSDRLYLIGKALNERRLDGESVFEKRNDLSGWAGEIVRLSGSGVWQLFEREGLVQRGGKRGKEKPEKIKAVQERLIEHYKRENAARDVAFSTPLLENDSE